MQAETKPDLIAAGAQDYEEWRASLVDTPAKQARYDEIAAKSDLWLQLVEARQAAGLTQRDLAQRLGVSQAQVARLEKHGYESYSMNSLRHYVAALGGDFRLEVAVVHRAQSRPPHIEETQEVTPPSHGLARKA